MLAAFIIMLLLFLLLMMLLLILLLMLLLMLLLVIVFPVVHPCCPAVPGVGEDPLEERWRRGGWRFSCRTILNKNCRSRVQGTNLGSGGCAQR